MTDDAEKIAKGIVNDVTRHITGTGDVDDDEVLETEIKMIRSRRISDGEVKLGISATLVLHTETWDNYLQEHVEPVVDKRRCPHPERKYGSGATVSIGKLVYTGAGEILRHEIKDEYLLDSKSDSNDQ